MQLLKDRIRKDGVIKEGNVLKVDSFLNHQMDIALINEMGKEFRRRFPDESINKILTIEASGIGIACITAQYFNCPVVFAKKTQSINIDGAVSSTTIIRFPPGRTSDVIWTMSSMWRLITSSSTTSSQTAARCSGLSTS